MYRRHGAARPGHSRRRRLRREPVYREVIYVENGGEGGIRTPDTLLRCNCLAGSPVRPLQHLSAAKRVGRNAACPVSITETAGLEIQPQRPNPLSSIP